MEFGRLLKTERPQQNLRRAAAEQRAFPAQDLAFHEADVRTAEDQQNVSRALPVSIPQFLQDRRQRGRRPRSPLKLVEGDDQRLRRRQRRVTAKRAAFQPSAAIVASRGSSSTRAASPSHSRNCRPSGACLPTWYKPGLSPRNCRISSLLPTRRRP